MPSLAHLREPLRHHRVELRDAAERDIPEILIAYQDDPEMHLKLGQERPPSGAELGRQADAQDEDRALGRRAALTIVEPGDDLCLGQIYVRELDWDHRRADLAMWLAPQVRGRGLAGAALSLAGQWLLGATALLRLQILADPGNAPMLAAARAAGFVEEGVLRGYYRDRRGRVDAAVLSLISRDL